jgi:hypothetical protein
MVDRLASERMFAVIVLGGIALTASAATCGGTVIDSTQATGVGGSGGSGGHGGMSTASSMGGSRRRDRPRRWASAAFRRRDR